MNERLLELRQRRGELLGVIAAQRAAIAESAGRLEYPMSVLDRGWSAVNYLRSHPLLLAGIAALGIMRRRSLSGLVKWSLLLWRGYRYLDGVKSGLDPDRNSGQRL